MWYPWTDAVPPLGLGNPGEAKDGVFPPSSGQQDVFDKAGIGWGSDVKGDLGTWLPSLGMKVWQHVKLHENYLSFDLTPTKLNNCNPSVLFPLDCLDFSDQRQISVWSLRHRLRPDWSSDLGGMLAWIQWHHLSLWSVSKLRKAFKGCMEASLPFRLNSWRGP